MVPPATKQKLDCAVWEVYKPPVALSSQYDISADVGLHSSTVEELVYPPQLAVWVNWDHFLLSEYRLKVSNRQ